MGPLVLFSKFFQDRSIEELSELAHALGADGFDLCVRPGHPVNPENVSAALPDAVRRLRARATDVPMITGNFDLLMPDHPTAEPILAAMDRADVRLLKLGYFRFDPDQQDYWAEVDRIRGAFDGWQKLAQKHGVRICYHTHSHRLMGMTASALAHLVRGFDPRFIGAYVDPGHLAIEGEEFDVAAAILKDYLGIVGLKDALIEREMAGDHGRKRIEFVPAGAGLVDWTLVFRTLAKGQFNGPLTIHCEFEVPPEQFLDTVKREVRFFRAKLAATPLRPA